MIRLRDEVFVENPQASADPAVDTARTPEGEIACQDHPIKADQLSLGEKLEHPQPMDASANDRLASGARRRLDANRTTPGGRGRMAECVVRSMWCILLAYRTIGEGSRVAVRITFGMRLPLPVRPPPRLQFPGMSQLRFLVLVALLVVTIVAAKMYFGVPHRPAYLFVALYSALFICFCVLVVRLYLGGRK